MKTIKIDNSGCIDHEGGIQLYCENCPPCFKGTEKICVIIRKQIEQVATSGK